MAKQKQQQQGVALSTEQLQSLAAILLKQQAAAGKGSAQPRTNKGTRKGKGKREYRPTPERLENVQAKIEGRVLKIEVDLSKTAGVTKKGKHALIATSHGVAYLDKEGLSLGINVMRPL